MSLVCNGMFLIGELEFTFSIVACVLRMNTIVLYKLLRIGALVHPIRIVLQPLQTKVLNVNRAIDIYFGFLTKTKITYHYTVLSINSSLQIATVELK